MMVPVPCWPNHGNMDVLTPEWINESLILGKNDLYKLNTKT